MIPVGICLRTQSPRNSRPEANASKNAILLPNFGMETSRELAEFLKYQAHVAVNHQDGPPRCGEFLIPIP